MKIFCIEHTRSRQPKQSTSYIPGNDYTKNLALKKQKVNGSTVSVWLAHFFYSLQNYKNIYSDYILCFLKLLPDNDANAQLVLGRKFSSIILQLRHLQSIHLNSDNVLTRLHLLQKKCFSPNLAKLNLHYHYINKQQLLDFTFDPEKLCRFSSITFSFLCKPSLVLIWLLRYMVLDLKFPPIFRQSTY